MPSPQLHYFPNRRMLQAMFVTFIRDYVRQFEIENFQNAILDAVSDTHTRPKDMIPIWIDAMYTHLVHKEDFDYVFARTSQMISYFTRKHSRGYVDGFNAHFPWNDVVFGSKPNVGDDTDVTTPTPVETEVTSPIDSQSPIVEADTEADGDDDGIPDELRADYETFLAVDSAKSNTIEEIDVIAAEDSELNAESIAALTMPELRQLARDYDIDLQGKRKKIEIALLISQHFGI